MLTFGILSLSLSLSLSISPTLSHNTYTEWGEQGRGRERSERRGGRKRGGKEREGEGVSDRLSLIHI